MSAGAGLRPRDHGRGGPRPHPASTDRRRRGASRVQRRASAGRAGSAYTERQIAQWTRLGPLYYRWALGVGGEIAFLAERGGRVVGFAALVAGPAAEVTAVFVRPAAAGRGVGSALLARVEAEARRRGIRRLVVKGA